MKRSDCDWTGSCTKAMCQAYVHLARRAARERECENFLWVRAPALDEPGDALHDHASLAGPGSGHNQQVAGVVVNDRSLRGREVETRLTRLRSVHPSIVTWPSRLNVVPVAVEDGLTAGLYPWRPPPSNLIQFFPLRSGP